MSSRRECVESFLGSGFICLVFVVALLVLLSGCVPDPVFVAGKKQKKERKHKLQKYPQNNPQQHKMRACGAKVPYPTEELALEFAKGRTKKAYCYECEYCDSFHLSKSDPNHYKKEGGLKPLPSFNMES